MVRELTLLQMWIDVLLAVITCILVIVKVLLAL